MAIPYLSTAFGAQTENEFNFGDVMKVAIIEKAKIVSVSGNTDSTTLTGITLESGSTFSEVVFVEGSAGYTQEFVTNANGAKYYTQTLNFRVDTEDNSAAHSVAMGKKYAALVQRGNGKWVILGLSNGIATSAHTANSTAEDSNHNYTMTGKNLGLAANVTIADVETLIG